MNYRISIIIAFCWFIITPVAVSQAYDQNKLLKLLPEIPSNLSTASDEEVNAFTDYCDSISAILEGYEEKYKRTSDSESNTALIMEYYDIRDSILDLNSTQRSKYYDLVALFSDLEYELSNKNDELKASIESLKYDSSKKDEVAALREQMYLNRVECSEKQIAIYLDFLRNYRARLDDISGKANKSETIPMPDHLNKNVSYVLMNVKNYLRYLSEVYKFNVVQDAMVVE